MNATHNTLERKPGHGGDKYPYFPYFFLSILLVLLIPNKNETI
jgi:hypothetical protein